MEIKLIGPVLFVRDIQRSRRFYEVILGQQVDLDLGGNVGYQGGLAIWEAEHASQTVFGNSFPGGQKAKNMELCFESEQLDEVCKRLEAAGVELAHPLKEQPWGQRVIRFFDPDGHLVEVGEPMGMVVRRCLSQGMTVEEAAQRTYMPLEIVRQMVKA